MTKQENNDNRHRPNVPPLRFRGFTAPWQRKRLGDITTYSKGKGYSKNDLKDEGVPVILYGSLYTDYRSEINDVNTFTDSLDGAILSRGGEVIVPASGETAEDIARASVVKTVNTIIGGDLNIIYPDSVIDSLFLALEITYGQCHDALVKKAQGTSVIHLRNSDIEDVDCSFPSLAEQEKIGTFFRALDELIAAREEELEKLCQMKAALLDAMFPNDASAERVTSATAHTPYDSLLDHTLQAWDIVPTETSTPHTPRLRFRGFTDPWQRMQLGELGYWDKGQPLSKTDIDMLGIYPCIHYGELFAYSEIINKVVSRTSITPVVLSSVNDILFPDSDVTPDGLGRCSALSIKDVILGGGINILRLTNNVRAPFCSLNIIKNRKQIIDRVTGTTVRHINSNALSEILISLSPSLAEQEQIGAFFRSQDERIATAIEQIDKLKKIKQACLKQMSV